MATAQPTAYADLSPMAKLVLFLDSLPDPIDDATVDVTADAPAVNEQHLLARSQLRDRMGQIITIDRAGTNRSIANV